MSTITTDLKPIASDFNIPIQEGNIGAAEHHEEGNEHKW